MSYPNTGRIIPFTLREEFVLKINLKARLKNKTFVISAVTLLIAFVYRILALFDIIPQIAQAEVLEILGMVVNILAFFGVLVDPTTEGISDSERALTYCTEGDVRQCVEATADE